MEGVAIEGAGGHHLIVGVEDADRVYVGSDEARVRRRALLLADALHQGAAGLDRGHADLVGDWVVLAWEAMLDEVVDAVSAPTLRHL